MATFRDRRSLTTLLAEELRALIRHDRLGAGDKLPSETELSARFGVARGSVREALKLLEQDGLIEVQHGRGRFVSALSGLAVDRPVTRFESVTEMLAGLGYEWTTRVLGVSRGAPEPNEAEIFGSSGDVVRLDRTREHDGRILIYSRNVFPAALLTEPGDDALDPGQFAGSLTDWLAARGRRPVSSAARLRAVATPPDVADAQGGDDDPPWLLISERCVDEDGLPVLISADYHRGDTFAFHFLRRHGT